MNKNIKLAVAGAVLALSATAANAGIVIPAGDWTVDIGGNVNMFATWTKPTAPNVVTGGIVGQSSGNTSQNMTTGLLPNYLSVSGSTRQNDLDVAFTISIQPGASNTAAFGNDSKQDNRQSFITFGDKSWGSIKVGKDLGVFASDAILSDMTLLGVGSGAAGVGNTTLGRIGTGYIYADWKPQIAYTTPNFSGFQATAAISQGWNDQSLGVTSGTVLSSQRTGASPTYEGKASYSFNQSGIDGKVWVSGIVKNLGAIVNYTTDDNRAYAGDIGINANVAGFGLTGYYYGGSGIGTTGQFIGGIYENATSKVAYNRDSNGGYVQATYVLPTKTKIGLAWGESILDKADTELSTTNLYKNEMWTAGIYHPLTKHLNLVAEYDYVRSENTNSQENHASTGSLGAILFF